MNDEDGLLTRSKVVRSFWRARWCHISLILSPLLLYFFFFSVCLFFSLWTLGTAAPQTLQTLRFLSLLSSSLTRFYSPSSIVMLYCHHTAVGGPAGWSFRFYTFSWIKVIIDVNVTNKKLKQQSAVKGGFWLFSCFHPHICSVASEIQIIKEKIYCSKTTTLKLRNITPNQSHLWN